MGQQPAPRQTGIADRIRLFLCGDVMTGRGIDQVLPHPGRPELHEAWVASARSYVELAKRASGPIPQPCPFDYVWGDALRHWRQWAPDLRIANLETSITTSDDYAHKGIHYRMHPRNVECLRAAGLNGCTLANVLDWGRDGLVETLRVLDEAGIRTAGAGRTASEAAAPAVLKRGRTRVLLFAVASPCSGTPLDWAATPSRPGVNVIPDLSKATAAKLAGTIRKARRSGDQVVLSIHWGGNWGYAIPAEQRRFAHAMIEEAGVAVVFGHSSHHPKAMEVHADRLILYGCGDFLNDYEGITGYEPFRSDLTLMYFVTLAGDGSLADLAAVPLKLERFRLSDAGDADAGHLERVLSREGAAFGAFLQRGRDGALHLSWPSRACA